MRPAGRACVACLAAAGCGRIGFASRDAGGAGSTDTIQLGDGSRPDIVFAANVVFVTSPTATAGSFGGLSAADTFCQATAVAASLPGTYVAWLSTSTTNAIDRLAGSRGWVRTDGVPFADQPADIAAGRVWAPISLLADGTEQAFAAPTVVTGTLATGMVAGSTCNDWTSTSALTEAGSLTETIAGWTQAALSSSCGAPTRIYCFGIGNQVAVSTSPPVGRRAFVSTAVGAIAGVGALDARCAQDAAGASIAGTFHALVATSTTSAIARFDTAGARWERLDGIPLAPTAAALAIGLRVPLDLHADGTYDTSTERVWTGAPDPMSPSSGMSCADWTSTSPSQSGELGSPRSSAALSFANGSRRCDDVTHYVYCLEL